MDKICIYINNYGTSNICMPDLSKQNPGIGGTQFEMFLLCQLLEERGMRFTLLLTHNQLFENKINYTIVKDINDAFEYCNKNEIDYLILRANDGLEHIHLLSNTKIIYWIHNFISYPAATKIAKSDVVERVVFVSQEEADYYYDHDISKKGVVIFNAIPSERVAYPEVQKDNIVAFIGDLSPYKMSDKLTKMWPRINKKVPDSKLLILGSGDLYGKGKTFGKYGIAEERYEEKILKPLIKHGLLDTISFSGLVRGNMNELISRAKVTAFMNPTETFCIAATDSIKNKVPVVCPMSTGYCDVVTKEVGYLYKNKQQAARKIIKILKGKSDIEINEENLMYLGKFSSKVFIESWISLFDNLQKRTMSKIKHKNNLFVNGKIITIISRFFRKLFHLPNGFSRIGIKWYIRKIFKH